MRVDLKKVEKSRFEEKIPHGLLPKMIVNQDRAPEGCGEAVNLGRQRQTRAGVDLLDLSEFGVVWSAIATGHSMSPPLRKNSAEIHQEGEGFFVISGKTEDLRG
jgi:hypothetical protein